MCVWARVFNYRWLRAGPIDCDPPGCVMDVIAFLPVLTKRDLAWEEYSKGGELFSVDESDDILFRLLNYFPTVFASFPLSLLLRRHPLCGQINRNSCFFPFALVFWIFHFDSIRYIYTCLKFCLSGVKFPLFLCDLSRDYLRFVTVQRIYRARYFITRMADRLIISFTDILCVYFKTERILKEFLPTYILILDDLSLQ